MKNCKNANLASGTGKEAGYEAHEDTDGEAAEGHSEEGQEAIAIVYGCHGFSACHDA